MNWVTVRDALRVLRVERVRGVRRIAGVDFSTVHRIENTKKYPKHVPKLESIEAILVACGSSLGAFFTTLDRAARKTGQPPVSTVLDALGDERTVEQMLGFLGLPEQAREAVRLHPRRTSEPGQGPALGSTPGPKPVTSTKSPAKPHRSSAHRKTGT